MVTVNAAPPPAEPTVSIDSPPAQIAQNGTTVSATATSGADVSKGDLLPRHPPGLRGHVGTVQLRLVPNGDEVGAQPIKAVVTDSLGRTAGTTVNHRVEVQAEGPEPSARSGSAAKRRIKASGKLMLPARMTAADGCSASRVAITAKLGKKSLVNKAGQARVELQLLLAFGARRQRRSKAVVIKARFAGNDSLSATSQVRKVR